MLIVLLQTWYTVRVYTSLGNLFRLRRHILHSQPNHAVSPTSTHQVPLQTSYIHTKQLCQNWICLCMTHDAYRGPLQRPYKGPFKILKTADKCFTLDINGSPDTVSIDRLKVAYPDNDTQSPKPSPTPTPLLQPTLTSPKKLPPQKTTLWYHFLPHNVAGK